MKYKSMFKEAKQRFFECGKMLEAMLGFSILLFSFVLSLIFADTIRALFEYSGFGETPQNIVFFLMIALILFTVSMPMLIGYFGFMYAIYKGERDVSVADVFGAFASPKKYFKAFFYGIGIFLRLLIIFGIPFFIAFSIYAGASQNVVDEPGANIVKLIIKAFSVAVFLVLYIIFTFAGTEGYLGLYNIVKGTKHPYIKSRKMLRGRFFKTFGLKLMFMLTVIISMLSIGALFLVTAPIMANAYFIYAEQTTEL